MAGRLVGGRRTAQIFSCPTDGATALTRGALLYVDETVAGGGVVRAADSAAESTVTVLFVANETIAATATSVTATLVEPGQVWEWDTAANTAANQLLKVHDMSTSLLLDNTATTDATTNGVWMALANVGAAADRKQLCIPLILGQVTA